MTRPLIRAALFLLTLLAFCAGAVHAQVSWVRSLGAFSQATAGTASQAETPTHTSTAGDDIIVGISWKTVARSLKAVTTNASGATFFPYTGETPNGSNENESIWICHNCPSITSSNTITITMSAGTAFQVEIEEYSNVASYGQARFASGNSTFPAVTITTQDANNMIVMVSASLGSAGVPTSNTGNMRDAGRTGTTSSQAAGAVCDNTAVSAGTALKCQVTITSGQWAAVALEVRSAKNTAMTDHVGSYGSGNSRDLNNTQNDFSVPISPEPTLAGNTAICYATWPGSFAAPTVTDDQADTFTNDKEVVDASFDNSAVFRAATTTGAHQVKFHFTSALPIGGNFVAACSTFYNIATSSPVDATCGTPTEAGPNLSCGSMTTNVADLIFFAAGSDGGLGYTNDGVGPCREGSGYTFLITNISVGYCTAYTIPSGTGSVNPAMYIPLWASGRASGPATVNQFNTIGVAYKLSNGQGTAPSGMYIAREYQYADSSGNNLFHNCPSTGGFTSSAVSWSAAASTSAVTDSNQVAWIRDLPKSGAGGALLYSTNSTLDSSSMCKSSTTDTGNDEFMYRDVYGVATSSPVVAPSACPNPSTLTNSGSNVGCWNTAGAANPLTPVPNITPANVGDLIIDTVSEGNGPLPTCTSPSGCVIDCPTYTGQTDANGMCFGEGHSHFYTTSTSNIAWAYTAPAAASGIGVAWEIKPAGSGVGSTGPTITNLTPTSGAVGTSIIITGTNFGASQGNSSVTFGGTPATTFSGWSATSIGVIVPVGANTGNVVVTVSGIPSNGKSFQVLQGTQTITFPQPPDTALTAGPVTLAATASSGLAVSYTSTTLAVCTVTGSSVTLVSVGTCSITANQAGNSNFAAAAPVSKSFQVLQGTQTITFPQPPDTALTAGPVTLAATASSGLAVSYTSTTLAVCTVTGSSVTLVSVGTCSITANQAGNSNFAAAAPVSKSFQVLQGTQTQTITFPQLPDTALTAGPVTLAATASSGLAVSYTSTTLAVCTVTGSSVTLVSVGTCSITANQAGNSNFAAAAPVSKSFQVLQGTQTQTITFPQLPDTALTAGPVTLAATASSGLAVSYTSTTLAVCTVTGSSVTLVSVGTCSITANQAGNSNFAAAAPVSKSFQVLQGGTQTPTLSMAKQYVGVSSNSYDSSSTYTLEMEKPGWPRAVTSGELIVVPTSWPNNRPPTWSDDKSNTWNAVFSTVCQDSTAEGHGFYYVANAAAGTSRLTQTFTSATSNTFADWAHFYNVATSSPVDQKSCTTGVTPASNTAPNISGTAYTTTANNDLIITCVFDESMPLGARNAWTSVTWPSGFTGLSDEPNLGHACAYEVQATAGSFTPTFTVSQTAHDRFTIISVAFMAGSGGSAPSNGASILLSGLQYAGAGGQALTVSLPCPLSTTAIVVRDSGQGVSSVTDSQGNTYTSPTLRANYPNIYYVNNPSLSPSMTVSLRMNTSGNQTLAEVDCLGNTAGIDTSATASNGATLSGTGQGSTYSSGTPSATACTSYPYCVSNQSSLTPSVGGDLILDALPDGNGPVEDCNQNASTVCVFDYGSSTTWTGKYNGDNQSYSNGDGMAHYYASTASAVAFNFGTPTLNSVDSQDIAFKASSGGGGGGPSISNLSPTSGPVGTSVQITGTNFGTSQGSSTVNFGGTPATAFWGWSATSIGVTVPTGANTGSVEVTVSGIPSNAVSFTVIPAPTITGVSPTGGAVGTTVTISGTNFGTSQGSSTVTFDGTPATTFSSWSATSVGATVPTGANTGNVVVTISGIPSNGVSFQVLQGTQAQTITFPQPADTAVTAGPVTLTATASSGLAVSYTSTTLAVCTVTGSSVTLVSVGTCSITANQAGNTNFAAAAPVSKSFQVLQGAQTITFPQPADTAVTAGPVALTATASSGLAVSYTSTTLPVCTVSGSSVTLVSVGTCSITANQAGNTNFAAAAPVSKSFQVLQGPTITGVSPTSGAVGTTVTISGTNFGTSRGSSTVTFGGTPATTFSSWSATSIGVTVPNLATTGNVVVTVNGRASNGANFAVTTMFVTLSPKRAAVTLSQSQQFTATVNNDPQNGGVSWSVDGINGGNTAIGTISSAGLFTPGTQPGVHTVTATSNSNNSLSASAMIAVTDLAGVFTYHNDSARTGQNLQEYALTTATVNPSTFGVLFSCPVDGDVYAEPLYVANFNIGGQTRNVVFVATEHDSVYAFDADSSSCVQLWQATFLSSNVTTVPAADTGETKDLAPEIGISSTPVIDPATNTIYVVAKTKETIGSGCSSGSPCYFHRLHALDLTSGAEKFGGPVVLSAPNFVPLFHLQRPALLLNNGTVYIGFGSHGDGQTYQGWLMAYNAGTLAQQWVWHSTDPTNGNNEGAIWGSGNGPALDASGNIYVETANGVFDGVNNFSDSVVKLSPAGARLDFFTPLDQAVMQQNDLDLGSGGPMILPDAVGSAAHPHVMTIQGKTGVVYLLDQTNLGGYHPAANQDLGEVRVSYFFGQPAYWNGNLYTIAGNDSLRQYLISNAAISITSSSASSNAFPLEAGTPAVSSSGTTNGIAWAEDTNAGYNDTGGAVILDAYDATNVSTWLYSSPGTGSGAAAVSLKFTVPTVANGKVYVGGQLAFTVFGLLPN